MIVVRAAVALAGAALVVATVLSAVKTVVLPRSSRSFISRSLFVTVRRVFERVAHEGRDFARRDKILALYGPLSLVMLPGVWVLLVLLGFTAVFWGVGLNPLSEAFATSGSSLMTLGFDRPHGTARVALSFAEATLGLGLIALLISYLPSMYAAFGRRELLVGLLETRAGIPPSPVEMLTRYERIASLPRIEDDLFDPWEHWFLDVEETHTTTPVLIFFRSPQPGRSWITAAGCVLDAASLVAAALDRPRSPQAELCVRSGYLALRRVADVFGVPYDPDPRPDDPISITRDEFDAVCDELTVAGIAVKVDRDAAWTDFAGWRVNYDAVLVALSKLVVAPEARWSSDRPGERTSPRIRRRRPR